MSRENPFNRSENKPIEGEGFTMRESDPKRRKKLIRLEEGALGTEEKLASLLDAYGSYSETYQILPSGMFDIESVSPDGPNLGYKNTPEGLYEIVGEIQKNHPEYRFDFETDPEGKWMKYTVSKIEKGG